MDVKTALEKKKLLLGQHIELSGTIRANFHFGERPNFEEAWVMPDPTKPTDFSEAIFLARPGLVRALFDKFTFWVGTYPYNHLVEVEGVLSESPNNRFPAALTEISRLKFHKKEEVTLFEFSNNDEE